MELHHALAPISRLHTTGTAHFSDSPSSSLLQPRRHLALKLGVLLFIIAVALMVAMNEHVQSEPSATNSQAAAASLDGSAGTTQTSTSSVTTSSSLSPHASTSLDVNGQDIPIPENGTSQQTITTPGGTSTVKVTNNVQQGSASNSNSVSTSFNVSSSSDIHVVHSQQVISSP